MENCEKEIEQLEARIAEVEQKLATPEGAADLSLCMEHGKMKEQMDQLVEKWEQASSELEELKTNS